MRTATVQANVGPMILVLLQEVTLSMSRLQKARQTKLRRQTPTATAQTKVFLGLLLRLHTALLVLRCMPHARQTMQRRQVGSVSVTLLQMMLSKNMCRCRRPWTHPLPFRARKVWRPHWPVRPTQPQARGVVSRRSRRSRRRRQRRRRRRRRAPRAPTKRTTPSFKSEEEQEEVATIGRQARVLLARERTDRQRARILKARRPMRVDVAILG